MQTFVSGNSNIRIEQSEPASATPQPAILLLHGAGGNVELWFHRLAPVLASAGIALYGPRYFERTDTTYADMATILDGRHVPLWLATAGDALTYIRSRPGIDPNRIAMLGISLGAFLSLALGTEDKRIKAIVELSGGLASPWDGHVTPSYPPTLIVHGENDHVVPVSEAVKADRLLTAQNVPHRMELLPAEDHWFTPAAQAKILGLVTDFLGEYLLGGIVP